MANWRTLEEMRREGFVVAECDRRLGPVLVKDLYGFGDVMGYDPLHLRRPRLVNGCLSDLQKHIKAYLNGGEKENGERFPPNEHLTHLMKYFDLFIYSFVKHTMRDGAGKLLKRKIWACRKFQFIVSPTGSGSFEEINP